MVSAALGISAVGAGVAASDHLTDYPVLSAQAVRYAIGAALLHAIATATRQTQKTPQAGPRTRLSPTDLVRFAALALTGMVLFNVAVVRAVTTGEPAVVATIVGLAPVGLALVVPAIERRRPSAGILAGAALAAAGAAVVEGFGRADGAALAWSAVALACEVAFTALAAPLLRTLSPIGLSIRACALASVLLVAAAALLDGTKGFEVPGAGEALAIAYLAVASTAIAFVLWYRAVARLGPERTGLFSGLMPVSAALVGAAVTAAPLQAGTLLGTVLVGAGIAVGVGLSRRGGRERRERRVSAPGAREADESDAVRVRRPRPEPSHRLAVD
jgi:drug/metabolite transporter (DMT)-like permease